MPKKKPIRGVDHAIMSVVLVVKDKTIETREQAYRELRYSDTVRQYFPRFLAHGPVQSCVMAGRVLFQGPDVVVKKIMTELTSGVWQQGNGKDLQEELARKAERLERAARRRASVEA